mgnify:CR=1 FL=1
MVTLVAKLAYGQLYSGLGLVNVNLKNKINDRMDKLQGMMESNVHLDNPIDVADTIQNVSKFWSVLSEEDRDYIHAASYAVEEQKHWKV